MTEKCSICSSPKVFFKKHVWIKTIEDFCFGEVVIMSPIPRIYCKECFEEYGGQHGSWNGDDSKTPKPST